MNKASILIRLVEEDFNKSVDNFYLSVKGKLVTSPYRNEDTIEIVDRSEDDHYVYFKDKRGYIVVDIEKDSGDIFQVNLRTEANVYKPETWSKAFVRLPDEEEPEKRRGDSDDDSDWYSSPGLK